MNFGVYPYILFPRVDYCLVVTSVVMFDGKASIDTSKGSGHRRLTEQGLCSLLQSKGKKVPGIRVREGHHSMTPFD